MNTEVIEGRARIKVWLSSKISKEMPVFYNPIMKLNRDISVLLLNSVNKKKMQIALPLAGTGIRGIRFLLELKKDKIKEISINDMSRAAFNSINNNLKLNKIKDKRVKVFNEDANLFLLNSKGFDYIDIDPFGTPNPFLDSAVKRLARGGILAVTATDTSALCGTYPEACLRKYWAIPKNDEQMHETGLRILIRKVQLVGMQFGKALMPLFSYSKDHYMRVFFLCDKSKKKTDEILKKHGMFNGAGPLWLGELWDSKLADKMYELSDDESVKKFLKIIKNESKIKVVGFYDIHKICKRCKKEIPKKNELISRIRKKGYKADETHFSPEAIRSEIGLGGWLK